MVDLTTRPLALVRNLAWSADLAVAAVAQLPGYVLLDGAAGVLFT